MAVVKKTNKGFASVKTLIESTVFLCGVLLGGDFGIGTILITMFTGRIMEFMFTMHKYDIKSAKHLDIKHTLNTSERNQKALKIFLLRALSIYAIFVTKQAVMSSPLPFRDVSVSQFSKLSWIASIPCEFAIPNRSFITFIYPSSCLKEFG